MVTAEWATVRMKWRDTTTGLSYSLGCKKHSASVCSIKETKTESCPMDAYSSFLINSSDQHPSFIPRCPRSSHRCPRPLLRMPRTDLALVQAETGRSDWLTRSLNRLLGQGHSLNACLSRAGQACGVCEGQAAPMGRSPPALSLARPHLSLELSFIPPRGYH